MIADLVSTWWPWITTGILHSAALAAVVWVIERFTSYRVWPGLLWALWLVVLLRPLAPTSLTLPDSIALAPNVIDPATTTIPLPIAVSLMAVWLLGALAISTTVALRYRRQRAAIHTAPANTLTARIATGVSSRIGLTKTPQLLVSETLPGPLLTGVLNPVVIIPENLTSSDTQTLEHILAHEFSHLKRRDHLVATAELAIAVLFWFNPAIWLAARRLKHLREVCCDRDACLALDSKNAYRATLAGRAATLLENHPPALAFGGGPSITMRLRWLMRPITRPRPHHHAVTLATATLVFAVFLPAAARLPALGITTASGETLDYAELQGSLQKKYAVFSALSETPKTNP